MRPPPAPAPAPAPLVTLSHADATFPCPRYHRCVSAGISPLRYAYLETEKQPPNHSRNSPCLLGILSENNPSAYPSGVTLGSSRRSPGACLPASPLLLISTTDLYSLLISTTDLYSLLISTTDLYSLLISTTDLYSLLISTTDLYSLVIADLYSLLIADLYSLLIADLYSLLIADLYSLLIADLYSLLIADLHSLLIADLYSLLIAAAASPPGIGADWPTRSRGRRVGAVDRSSHTSCNALWYASIEVQHTGRHYA
jgi:hypothetical protein